MRLKIKYTAGNPPVEHEQTHDFPEAPISIEVDIPKMEIWVTLAERRDSGDWKSRRRTLCINPEINTPHVPTPGMVRDPFEELCDKPALSRRSWLHRTWDHFAGRPTVGDVIDGTRPPLPPKRQH